MKLKDFDFRIWDYNSKKYIEEIEIHKFQKYPIEVGYTFIDTDRITEVEFIKNNNDLELELFTGFCDKNGEKIYEGDILKYTKWCEQYMEDAEHSETIYEIVCFDRKRELYSKLPNGECGWFFNHFMNDKNNTIEEMCIIGNIHENMDLLK